MWFRRCRVSYLKWLIFTICVPTISKQRWVRKSVLPTLSPYHTDGEKECTPHSFPHHTDGKKESISHSFPHRTYGEKECTTLFFSFSMEEIWKCTFFPIVMRWEKKSVPPTLFFPTIEGKTFKQWKFIPETIHTGHDMPTGLASLTQFLCCA